MLNSTPVQTGELMMDILIESTIAFEYDLGGLTSEVTVEVGERQQLYSFVFVFPQVKITLPTIGYSFCLYDRS